MNGKLIIRNSQLVNAKALPLRRDTECDNTQPGSTAKVSATATHDHALHTEDLEILRKRFTTELAQLFDNERQAAHVAGRNDALREAEERLREKAEILSKEYENSQAEMQQQQRQLRHSAQQLVNAVEELGEYRNSLLRDSEPLLIEIAATAVTKILGHAAKDGSLIRRVVSKQLAHAATMRPLRIRVSRQDMAQIKATDTAQKDAWQDVFVADEALAAGDCFIETEHGTLEAGIARQLEHLRQILLKAYRNVET